MARNGNGNRGKPNTRIFGLQYEEAPTVDMFAGEFLIASHPAYVLIDMIATHSCMSEHFMHVCGLSAENIPDLAICINTPVGPNCMMTRIVISVDVLVENLHMPVDMLILPMSNFDIILDMNWLNQYQVTIDCYNAILSFKLSEEGEAEYRMIRQRPITMPIKDL